MKNHGRLAGLRNQMYYTVSQANEYNLSLKTNKNVESKQKSDESRNKTAQSPKY